MHIVRHAGHALAIAFLAVCSTTATGLAQSTPSGTTGTSTVSGNVTNAASQGPVANATVELIGNGQDKTTHTDQQGLFSFSSVAAGTYSLKTTAIGYTPSTSTPFSVGVSEGLTLAISLQPITGATLRTISSIRVNGKQSVNTTSTPTVVITNRQFIAQGQVLVEQGLEQTPGVTVQHYDGGLGSVATITIRGAGGFAQGSNTGYELLVLQDGEPMRNGQYGDADVSTLTPSIYSRVEVSKGVGGTSLFGANTIGGTVNFVTRDPLATEGGQFIGGLGGFGTYDYSLIETNTIGKFGYIFDLHRLGSQGPVPGSLYADYVTNVFGNNGSGCGFGIGPCGPIWHPTQDFSLLSDLLKVKYQFSPVTYVTVTQQGESDMRDQLGLLTNPTSTNSGATLDPNGNPYFFGFPGDQLWNIQPKIGLDFHTQVAGGDLLLRTYGGILERVDDGNGEPQPLICCFLQRSVDRLYGDEAYWTKILGNHTLTIAAGGNGDSYFYGTASSFSPDGVTPAKNLSFNDISYTGGKQIERTYMVRDEWQVTPKFNLNLTGYYSSYDTLQVKRFDPRLGVVYRPDVSTAVRFSAASGFAAPRLSDLYNPFDPTTANFDPRCDTKTYQNQSCAAPVGNASLQAEKGTGYDLGVDHTFGFANRGLVSFDAFRTNLTGHIFTIDVPAPSGTGNFTSGPNKGLPILFLSTPLNLPGSVYTGFEFNGVLPVTHNFSVTGYYTTQAAYPTGIDLNTEQIAGDVLNNQQYQGVPVHQLAYGLRYDNLAGASAFFRGDYFMQNNSYAVAPFWVYNAGISEPMPNNNTVTFSWQNIFNKNATIFSLFNGGVPYPGAAGLFGETAHPTNPHSIMVTLTHSWGSLKGL
ncbi:MAG TPA: TonB-dependent receptor [Candidatus Baltobacteraceae bacterium]|jgi:outer membrane receptor protein involved in Fe transport|nr:TonB-dependent receptor [Candidatus Baltobacteraceae bacterium]